MYTRLHWTMKGKPRSQFGNGWLFDNVKKSEELFQNGNDIITFNKKLSRQTFLSLTAALYMSIYTSFFSYHHNTPSPAPVPSFSSILPHPHPPLQHSLSLQPINNIFLPSTLSTMQNGMFWNFPILERNGDTNGSDIRRISRYVALLADLGGISSENEAVRSTLDPCFLRGRLVAGKRDVNVAACECYPSVFIPAISRWVVLRAPGGGV